MAKSNYILSKSTFVKGNQCTKALYLNRFHKELKDKISDTQEAIFAQGANVGLLAQKLFPGGIDLSPEDYTKFDQAVEQTKVALLKGNKTLYEPAFVFDEVLCALDILSKVNGKWSAFEVKSSTSVSDTYILDSALQYYVITNSGIKIDDIFIVYINNQYIKNGELDLNKLFIKESILEQVLELQSFIPTKIKELKTVLNQNKIPKVEIGEHCGNPYPCDFAGHCWKHIPENSVFDIANLRAAKKFELYQKDVVEVKDIPRSFPLNDKQWQQVESHLNDTTVIAKDEIKYFIEQLNFPLRFLDFETFQLCIPVFDNSRPYQQIVSQYSLHTLSSKKGKLQHAEFLAEANGKDPRIGFVESLIRDCGNKGLHQCKVVIVLKKYYQH